MYNDWQQYLNHNKMELVRKETLRLQEIEARKNKKGSPLKELQRKLSRVSSLTNDYVKTSLPTTVSKVCKIKIRTHCSKLNKTVEPRYRQPQGKINFRMESEEMEHCEDSSDQNSVSQKDFFFQKIASSTIIDNNLTSTNNMSMRAFLENPSPMPQLNLDSLRYEQQLEMSKLKESARNNHLKTQSLWNQTIRKINDCEVYYSKHKRHNLFPTSLRE